MDNLLSSLPDARAQEVVERLLASAEVRIERIVSHGQASPDGFWYDQDEHEWVLVVRGAARLRIEGEEECVELSAGAFRFIPAHQRHRVEWTSSDEPTIWLALFWKETERV